MVHIIISLLTITVCVVFVSHIVRNADYIHKQNNHQQTRLTRIETLINRRKRVYRLYINLTKEANQYKAVQAKNIMTRIDNEIAYYSIVNISQYN